MSSKKEKEKRHQRQKSRRQQARKDRSSGGGGFSLLDYSKAGKDVNLLKLKEGRVKLDIVPFEITEDWYSKLRSKAGTPVGLEPGDYDYKLEAAMHRNVGPENKNFLCLRNAFGKPCYSCEQMDELDWDKDEKEIRSLRPSWRVHYNAKDLLGEEQETELLEVSYALFEGEMLEELDTLEEEEGLEPGTLNIDDLEDGRSVRCRAKNKTIPQSPRPFLEYKNFEFPVRKKPYDEEIIEDSYPLDSMLKIPTYEQVRAAFLGMDEEEELRERLGDPPDDDTSPDDDDASGGEGKNELADKLLDMSKRDLVDYVEEEKLEDFIKGYRKLKAKDLREAIFEAMEEKEKPKKETDKKESEKTKKDKDKPECPSDHEYGTDCDEYPDDCDDCDLWSDCAKAQDEG